MIKLIIKVEINKLTKKKQNIHEKLKLYTSYKYNSIIQAIMNCIFIPMPKDIFDCLYIKVCTLINE